MNDELIVEWWAVAQSILSCLLWLQRKSFCTRYIISIIFQSGKQTPYTNLSYSLQKRFQPVLITFTVTIQKRQYFSLCCICPSDTRAHQALEERFKKSSLENSLLNCNETKLQCSKKKGSNAPIQPAHKPFIKTGCSLRFSELDDKNFLPKKWVNNVAIDVMARSRICLVMSITKPTIVGRDIKQAFLSRSGSHHFVWLLAASWCKISNPKSEEWVPKSSSLQAIVCPKNIYIAEQILLLAG